jgi:hypothetical protein
MYDLIDCKKQSPDTTSSTEHQILDQCYFVVAGIIQQSAARIISFAKYPEMFY